MSSTATANSSKANEEGMKSDVQSLYSQMQNSFEDARKALSVISEDQSNARGRDKLYRAALDAGQHLASLLQVLGALHPACSVVGSSLAAIIALEQERGEVQSVIAAVYLKLCECLSRVRGIPESFTSEGLSKDKLASFLDRAKGVIEQIGSFSQQYHGDKSLKFRCKRVLFSSSDKKKVDGFLSAIQELNEELNFVVAVRTMEMTQQARFESVDISKLQPHSADIERLLPVDGPPWPLEETVVHHIAQIIRRQFTDESAEHDVLRAVKIVLRTQDNLDDENKALFDIKYQFELERINRKLDYWGTRLLEELRKGPHSLIPDGDLQEIWKDTAGRKSSVEWRLFIDGLSHYFQREFMTNPARKHKQDSWAVGVITRVCYYPDSCMKWRELGRLAHLCTAPVHRCPLAGWGPSSGWHGR